MRNSISLVPESMHESRLLTHSCGLSKFSPFRSAYGSGGAERVWILDILGTVSRRDRLCRAFAVPPLAIANSGFIAVFREVGI